VEGKGLMPESRNDAFAAHVVPEIEVLMRVARSPRGATVVRFRAGHTGNPVRAAAFPWGAPHPGQHRIEVALESLKWNQEAGMRRLWSSRPLMCPEVGRLLQRYLDGEIDEVKAQRIARHLEDCRRCGMKAETYAAIKRSLREHRPEVPADAVERLRAFGQQLAAGERPDEDSASA